MQGKGNVIGVFDVATKKYDPTLLTVDLAKIETFQMLASKDGKMLLVYTKDNRILEYKFDGNILALSCTYIHYASISCVALSPEGRTIAISSADDRTVSIYDMSYGINYKKLLAKIPAEINIRGPVELMEFTPDGKTLIVYTGARDIKFYDVATGTLATTVNEVWALEQIIFSNDGKTMAFLYAIGTKNKGDRLFDISKGVKHMRELPSIYSSLNNNLCSIQSIMFDADDNLVVVSNWDVPKQLPTLCTEVWKLNTPEYTMEQALLIYYAQKQKGGSVTISECSQTLQKMYKDIFTDEQKKQLQHVLKGTL